MKIQDIAQLKTGIYALPDTFGNTAYLQVKYFDIYGTLSTPLRTDININDKFSHHLLTDGDVLFSAKGARNFAAVFRESSLKCVASSSFFIIRPTIDIIPEYLAWFINNPVNLQALKAEAKGSSIPSISIKSLGDLEIKIPDISTQKNIVNVHQLRLREKKLVSEIDSLKERFLEAKLLSII